MFVTSTVIIGIVAYLKLRYDIEFFGDLLGYNSILVIFQSLSLYNIFTYWKNSDNSIFKKILLVIDKHSFGIYMIHMIVINVVIYYFQLNPFEFFGYLGIILLSIFVLIVSGIFTNLINRIPYINKII